MTNRGWNRLVKTSLFDDLPWVEYSRQHTPFKQVTHRAWNAKDCKGNQESGRQVYQGLIDRAHNCDCQRLRAEFRWIGTIFYSALTIYCITSVLKQ